MRIRSRELLDAIPISLTEYQALLEETAPGDETEDEDNDDKDNDDERGGSAA